jgi:hypothetical protein
MLDALRYVVASRPHSPQEEERERLMHPLERRMKEEMAGSNFNRKKPPSWQYA